MGARLRPAPSGARPFARAIAIAAGALAVGFARSARADNCHPANGLSTCIDADNLWPHAGGGAFAAIGSTTTTPAGKLAFGLVGTLLSQPIGVRVASPDPAGSTVFVVDKAFDATLLFALGVTDRIEVTLAAPATLYQTGPGLAGVTPSGSALSRSAVRDVRLGLTVAIVNRPRTGELRGPGLTARFELGAPTGSIDTFSRSPTVVGVPSLTFDWKIGRVDLAAEASARLRGEAKLANAVVGSEIGGALGASVDILKDRWLSVGAEAFALYATSKQLADPRDSSASTPPLVPAEWLAHVSTAHFFGGDLVLSLGGGSSFPEGSHAPITSPKYRLDFAIRYAPTGRDTDGDGIPDRDDKCPNDPEDHDGFQDADGCPDPDNDGDGIPDVRDRCRDEPEDFDGHEDADGCPDLDDDHDGIPDAVDKCRNEPEDFDGFQDTDGCPDLDNDGDGIPDARDKCPNMAEDRDGYQDADGCPDPDNDGDGIPDVRDACPDEPEDHDGFQDTDGCPDLDNDEDGVPDASDACPNVAETINGDRDDDGCPEPGAKSLVHWSGEHVLVDAPARFAPGKAAPPPALEKQLRMMAQLVRGRAPLESVVLEAYADRAGDRSTKALELAAARSDAVKKIFAAAGIPADVIVAAAGDPTVVRSPGAPPVDVTVTRKTHARRAMKGASNPR